MKPANASTIHDIVRPAQFSLCRRAILPKLSARFASRIVSRVSGFVLANPDVGNVSGLYLQTPT